MFGKRLKELREENKLTQQELADILHLGRATIAGYETKGKEPDFEKLTDMANYFNVTIDYLMGNDTVSDFELSPKISKSSNASLDDLINSLKWENLTDEQKNTLARVVYGAEVERLEKEKKEKNKPIRMNRLF